MGRQWATWPSHIVRVCLFTRPIGCLVVVHECMTEPLGCSEPFSSVQGTILCAVSAWRPFGCSKQSKRGGGRESAEYNTQSGWREELACGCHIFCDESVGPRRLDCHCAASTNRHKFVTVLAEPAAAATGICIAWRRAGGDAPQQEPKNGFFVVLASTHACHSLSDSLCPSFVADRRAHSGSDGTDTQTGGIGPAASSLRSPTATST
jgi:hypothetical protein